MPAAVIVLLVLRLPPRGPAGWLSGPPDQAGTHRSRWYVTPAFTTFLVFLLLLYADPESAHARFGERVGETLLGVGLAYLFGLALPALGRRMTRTRAMRTAE